MGNLAKVVVTANTGQATALRSSKAFIQRNAPNDPTSSHASVPILQMRKVSTEVGGSQEQERHPPIRFKNSHFG